MPKTLIDIDDQLLADAATELGTKTKAATVRQALREAVQARRRQKAIDSMHDGSFFDAEGFDWDAISADPDGARAAAWRDVPR